MPGQSPTERAALIAARRRAAEIAGRRQSDSPSATQPAGAVSSDTPAERVALIVARRRQAESGGPVRQYFRGMGRPIIGTIKALPGALPAMGHQVAQTALNPDRFVRNLRTLVTHPREVGRGLRELGGAYGEELAAKPRAEAAGELTGDALLVLAPFVPKGIRAFRAARRPPVPHAPPPGVRLAPKPLSLEQVLSEALAATRVGPPVTRTSLPTPRFGETPRPAQPAVSFSTRSTAAPKAARQTAARQGVEGLPFEREAKVIQRIQTQPLKQGAESPLATRARIVGEQAKEVRRATPLVRVKAHEFAEILRGREKLRTRVGNVPPGFQDAADRARFAYERAKTARASGQQKQLAPRELLELEQAVRRAGAELSGVERSAKTIAKTARGIDIGTGFGAVGSAIRQHPVLAGGVAGATTGALFGQTPEERVGGAIALGLGGAGLVAGSRALARNPLAPLELTTKLRSQGYLTGLAIPKNIVGGVGAVRRAAIEQGTLRPVREMLRPLEMGRSFVRGVRQPIDIGIAGNPALSRFALPARFISGIDKAFLDALGRAGMSQAEVNRLLLRRPLTEVGMSPQGAALAQHPFARAGWIYQRTPLNTARAGGEELIALAPKSTWQDMAVAGPRAGAALRRRRALTYSDILAGAVAAKASERLPRKWQLPFLGVLGAGAAVGALPFAIGGSAVIGTRALQGTSPLPEYGWDVRRMVKPQDWIALRRLLASE